MTPERWRDVRRLFDAARELEGEARVEFLGRACAESASLLADVERLFRAHAAAGSFIEEPLVRLVTQGSDGAEGAGEVRRIGPYAVERTLGQGGMGTVYEALRADEEYRRRVAIKVVRHGLDSDDWVRRFRSERQILADLDHPNIARLIEGGTLEDGRPYLVMEFVEGQPLDAACDQRRWSIRQRLELFVKVCGAVQFAHQSLIVHRDLKPGNILLSAAGEPKLLDFGIAKLLQPGDFPQTLALTEPGMRPMTLAYASPEQVAGGSLTTASDVYALGVVLYELLTGRSPYPSAGPDLPRAICEEAPPRPSAAAETHAGLPLAGGEDPTVTPESLAALRASDPRRLERTLAGDLDNIVLEALRKEPERRYPSAAALAADIERYLDHRPVLARPDTLTYRSRKFVRRHRGGVATAALAAVALIVFVSVLIAERNRSRYQETRANAVKDAMIDLFQVSDPDLAQGRQITAREVMDRGAAELPEQLSGQPVLLADMLETIGAVYRRLGDYDAATQSIEGAIDLRRQQGADPAESVSALLEHGDLLLLFEDWEGARSRFDEALKILQDDRDRDERQVQRGLSGLAEATQKLGQLGAAEALHREALELARSLGGADDRTATTLRKVGDFFLQQGDFEAARAAFLEGLEIRRRLHGEDHSEVAGLTNSLALVHRREGDYARAEALFRRTLEIHQKIYDGSHPGQVTARVNLAELLFTRGRNEEAERLTTEALAFRRDTFGADHPQVAWALNLLGRIRRAGGDMASAEARYREALAILPQTPEHASRVATITTNLAQLLRDRGEAAEAEALFHQALQLTRETFGGENERVATILNSLGRLARNRGELEAAERLYREALAMRRRLLGAEHPDVATTAQNLAVVLRRRGDYAAAEGHYRTALEIFRARFGDRHRNVALVTQNLAAVLIPQGRADEAEGLARQAVEDLRTALPEGHLWTLAARSVLGESLAELGRFAEAETILLETHAAQRAAQGEEGSLTVRTRERLAALYRAWGKPGRVTEFQ